MSFENDYILMVASCKKYLKERRIGQIEQFLKNPKIMQGIRYFHLEGDSNKFIKTPELKYIIDEKNNIIYTNTKDDYLSLPHKIICGMKAIYENYNFKYIFKTDDDQRLLIDNIFYILDKQLKEKKPDYFGKIMNFAKREERWELHKDENYPKGYYVGDGLPMGNGRFYGLSYRNVKDLVRNKYDEIKKEMVEDCAIAKYQKIEYRTNNMYVFNNEIFNDIDVWQKKKNEWGEKKEKKMGISRRNNKPIKKKKYFLI